MIPNNNKRKSSKGKKVSWGKAQFIKYDKQNK